MLPYFPFYFGCFIYISWEIRFDGKGHTIQNGKVEIVKCDTEAGSVSEACTWETLWHGRFVYLVILVLELRVFCLRIRSSTAWVMPPAHFGVVILEIMPPFLPRLACTGILLFYAFCYSWVDRALATWLAFSSKTFFPLVGLESISFTVSNDRHVLSVPASGWHGVSWSFSLDKVCTTIQCLAWHSAFWLKIFS
jgi:hypothetical protein